MVVSLVALPQLNPSTDRAAASVIISRYNMITISFPRRLQPCRGSLTVACAALSHQVQTSPTSSSVIPSHSISSQGHLGQPLALITLYPLLSQDFPASCSVPPYSPRTLVIFLFSVPVAFSGEPLLNSQSAKNPTLTFPVFLFFSSYAAL